MNLAGDSGIFDKTQKVGTNWGFSGFQRSSGVYIFVENLNVIFDVYGKRVNLWKRWGIYNILFYYICLWVVSHTGNKKTKFLFEFAIGPGTEAT